MKLGVDRTGQASRLLRWVGGLAVAVALSTTPTVCTYAAQGAPPAPPRASGLSCESAPRPMGPHGDAICISGRHYVRDVCRALAGFAAREALPPGFFARLIWQESRFDANAVSPKGAQGIAQFMPQTAALRSLADSFNPADALAKAAAYLNELRQRFGNLGLAAAAYNAGEARAGDLLADGRPAPPETRSYVQTITGLPLSAWATAKDDHPTDFKLDDKKPFAAACAELAKTRKLPVQLLPGAQWKPWGAEIGASFSPAGAQRIFRAAAAELPAMLGGETPMFVRQRNLSFGTRARYTVRIGRDNRAAAQRLCQRIAASGSYCIVRQNGFQND